MKRRQIVLLFLLALIVLAGGVKAYTPTEAQERAARSFSKTLRSDPDAYDPPALQWQAGQTLVHEGLGRALRPSPAQQEFGTDHPHQVLHLTDAEVHTHQKRGVVFVRPKTEKSVQMARRPLEDPNDSTLGYLAAHPEIFNLADPKKELHLRTSRIDELGMSHLAYQQRQNHIPIWGRQLISHFDTNGRLNSINCLIEPAQTSLETQPAITASQAVEIAQAAISSGGQSILFSPEKLQSPGLAARAELYYWNKGPRQKLELAWVVDLHPNLVDWQRFFIRADDGTILETYNATVSDWPMTAQAKNLAGQTITIYTYQIGNTYYLIDGSEPMFVSQSSSQLINDPQGVIYAVSANNHDLTSSTTLSHFTSTANTWSDAAAVSSQDYVRQTYDFYHGLPNYARNSFDDQGSTMMTVLHVTENGQKMDNAYWNGSFVVLGDGLTYFKPLAGGLDIIAHEFTHAVVQYTANLEYQYQSGALNETYADIGGVSVDTQNYTLGEDIVKSTTYFPTGALRDMANPHNGGSSLADICWQPATMSEYRDLPLSDDNGGVHVNGGITNFAAYKIFDALGRAKGDQILYRALIHYLTSQANFTDFRIAAAQAAADIYGESSAEQNAVKLAFDEVGITEGTGTTPPADNPVVTGDQYIIGVDDNSSTLWRSNGFSDINDLTSLQALDNFMQVNTGSGRPISVDRYGQYIYVVDSQFNLRRIKPDGSGETVMSYATSQWGWWSVAVSPSGQKLALTRNNYNNPNENIIWVYDLTQSPPSVSPLTLKHPTTDQNNTYDDIVDYADTMVFLDENTIAYDCYNTIQSPGSGTINFWDVNVIDAATGNILPVIPPQPNGVNVGNPTVASTNSSVLCVELVDENQQTNKVTGVNLATGEIATIFDNGDSLAYPHYSPDDKQMIFTKSISTGFGTNSDVYRISLADDKIHASGSPAQIITSMQLPYWFVVGSAPSIITPQSCTIKAGANNNDSLTFTGVIDADAGQLNQAATCQVQISSSDAMIYQETLQASLFKIKNGNYTYKHSQSQNDPAKVTALSLNSNNNSLTLKLSHVDLTGLDSPVYISVEMGGYSGHAEIRENIINRSGPIPMQLLCGYEDALRVDSAKLTASSLTIKGAISVQDASVVLSQYPMTLTWGSQNFTIPQSGFQKSGSRFIYKDAHGANGSVSGAAFDLIHCTFQITVKNAAITDQSGTVTVGVQFAAFDQTDDYTIN